MEISSQLLSLHPGSVVFSAQNHISQPATLVMPALGVKGYRLSQLSMEFQASLEYLLVPATSYSKGNQEKPGILR